MMYYKIIKQTLLVLLIISATFLKAQVLNISNETIVHDSKERSAIKVMIAPDTKAVKKAFRDFMDDRYDVEIEGIGFLKNKDVLYTEPTIIAPISNQQMKLFAKVVGERGETAMYVFGQLGYNNQITPMANYAEYVAMKELTVTFLHQLLPNYYQHIVEDQKDELADLEDDRDDMRKKLNKNKDKIAELQKENGKLERKIAAIEVQLEQSIDKLSKKKAALKKVNTKLDKSNEQK